jgi:hypothetical protein
MPEFILNTPPTRADARRAVAYGYAKPQSIRKVHPWNDLDEFAQGYIEAMFFTNGDTGDDDENRLNDLGVKRLTHKSVALIKADCDAFQKENAALLAFAYSNDDYTAEQAGRDFWFTRQHHGVGYWDRKELKRDAARRPDGAVTDLAENPDLPFLGALDELLSAGAHAAGEVVEVCAVRGWIYYR